MSRNSKWHVIYFIQRTSEIMHNLCPNPRNDLGKYFNHILEYLQTSTLQNIYQIVILLSNYHILGLSVSICGFKGINVFCIKPCLIAIASATSSCSYNIGLSCTTSHNIAPYVYIARGYTSINNVMILFHIYISNSRLHKQCLVISTRSVQKGYILSTFPPLSPTITWYNSMNQQPKETNNFPTHFYAPQPFPKLFEMLWRKSISSLENICSWFFP